MKQLFNFAFLAALTLVAQSSFAATIGICDYLDKLNYVEAGPRTLMNKNVRLIKVTTGEPISHSTRLLIKVSHKGRNFCYAIGDQKSANGVPTGFGDIKFDQLMVGRDQFGNIMITVPHTIEIDPTVQRFNIHLDLTGKIPRIGQSR